MNYDFTYELVEYTKADIGSASNVITEIRFSHCIRKKSPIGIIQVIMRRFYVAPIRYTTDAEYLYENSMTQSIMVQAIENSFGPDQITHMQNLLIEDLQTDSGQ